MKSAASSIKFAQSICLFTCLTVIPGLGINSIQGQDADEQRPLEHKDYDRWNTISRHSISRDGKWITFVVKPGKGDSTLHVRHVQSGKEYKVLRGGSARFSHDSQVVAYIVSPDPELLKKLKKDKSPAADLPQSHLEIVFLETGRKTTVEKVSRFRMPEEGDGWIAFQISGTSGEQKLKPTSSNATTVLEVTGQGLKRAETTPSEKPSSANRSKSASTGSKNKAEAKTDSKRKKKEKTKKSGSTLALHHLESQREFRFSDVVQYRFNKTGTALAMSTSGEQPEDDGVAVWHVAPQKLVQLALGRGNYGVPVFNESGDRIAFLTDKDDYDHPKPAWSIYLASSLMRPAAKLVDSKTPGMPKDWWVASTSAPRFSEDGRLLSLNTAPIPEDRDEDSAEKKEAEDKAVLDIWHWQDPFLQPQQLLRVAQDRNRSYTAVVHLKSKRFVQLATKEIPSVSLDPKSRSNWVVGISAEKYNKQRSWDLPGLYDSYLIDINSGRSFPVLKASRGTPQLSLTGRYVAWWDGEQKKFFGLSTASVLSQKELNPIDLGEGIPYRLDNELHDTPSTPRPYGIAGQTPNDEGLLIYDRWDVWKVDPAGKKPPVCLTNGTGRKKQIRFRLLKLDPEARAIDLRTDQYLSALNHQTKASGFYRMVMATDKTKSAGDAVDMKLEPLLMLDESVTGLRKAKDADVTYFTRSTFRKSPDLWASTLDFESIRRISLTNPQQSEYRWGSAELVRWNAADGQPLNGILYKPDNFDPDQKHPMIVYFYERYSDRLHSYYPPAAGRSIINFSFYVSRGYLIFIPDIPYKTGAPGPSAVNAILPGVDHLVKTGFVDEKRIGLQGHSWGGYQTAFLVTQTDRFACAESGAPVSNMTSAYGGIRWGSGMSRMFQYERTQSRIGATLWEARDKYIANSPLFFADRITTPLLILHNDKDTAVPWYQGIELFVALRRLEKPAWMLNYNNDPHWVMGDANRLDFAKRMQQFFDHYLMDAPMPVWMAEGIPAVDKGKEFGFEPAAKKSAKESAKN